MFRSILALFLTAGVLTAAPIPRTAELPQDPLGQAMLGVTVSDLHDVKANGEIVLIGQSVNSIHAFSAAEKAGLQPNDLIVGIGSEKLTSLAEMKASLALYRPGATVPVTVMRKDKDNVSQKVVIPVRLHDSMGVTDRAIGSAWNSEGR